MGFDNVFFGFVVLDLVDWFLVFVEEFLGLFFGFSLGLILGYFCKFGVFRGFWNIVLRIAGLCV